MAEELKRGDLVRFYRTEDPEVAAWLNGTVGVLTDPSQPHSALVNFPGQDRPVSCAKRWLTRVDTMFATIPEIEEYLNGSQTEAG